jgi:hypothetical protein
MAPRFWVIAGVTLLFRAVPVAGQVKAAAPAGILSGLVQDSVTGEPVGYALISTVPGEQRVFASESGRFSLSGLPSGQTTLRVTQIGYRAATFVLELDTRPQDAGPPFTLRIVRQPLLLPDLLVRSDECPAGADLPATGESGTVLDEAFRNAERMLAVQKAYPYKSSLQHVTTILNAERVQQRRTVDTIELRSRDNPGYQRGRVLELRRSSDLGRAGLREHANYFQASDLARPEFRKNHCFWVVGMDSVRGFPVFRVEFRPLPEVQTPDWAGILQIDSASMHLLRSEAWLVNLPPSRTTITAARCSALYTQLVPTLVLEFQVHCVSAQNVRPPAFADDRWTLLQRSFVGKRPN